MENTFNWVKPTYLKKVRTVRDLFALTDKDTVDAIRKHLDIYLDTAKNLDFDQLEDVHPFTFRIWLEDGGAIEVDLAH